MKEKRIAYVDEQYCKGCLLCTTVCPAGALRQGTEVNRKGYQFIVLDAEKCIGCGSCYKICPDYVFEIK